MKRNEINYKGQKAVTYARVSSERQAEEGFSIEAQLDLAKKYAKDKGLIVNKENIYIDEESAKDSGRTKFNQMLSFLRKNKEVQHLIVEKTDRLYRNLLDYAEVVDLPVNIHMIKENEVLNKYSSSHSKLMQGIKVIMAKHYIDNLSEEVRKGMNKKADLGEWPSKAPIGYVRNITTHLLDINKSRALLVKRLFEEYAKRNVSMDMLKVFAFKIGLRSVNNKKINKAGIQRILRNIIYTGTHFIYKGHLYNNAIHESIISADLFYEVQEILNGKRSIHQSKRSFAFRGMIKCHICGCSMTPDLKKGKYIYYRCTQYKGKCKNSVTEQQLVELFGDIVKKVQIAPKDVFGLKKALKESKSNKEKFHKEAIEALQLRHNRINNQLEQLYDDRLNGVVGTNLWQRKSNQLNEELQKIEYQLTKYRTANNDYIQLGSQIIELAQDAYELYLNQNNNDRAKLIKYLLSNCTISDVTLYATYRKPFNLLAEGSNLNLKRG